MRQLLTLILLLYSIALRSQTEFVPKGDNLIAEGIPPVPQAIVSELGKYTESRSTRFCEWHPKDIRMIVSTRGANTAQLFGVNSPGGKLIEITDLDEPVRNALYEPNDGNYFLFLQDTGGDEFDQIFRYDMQGGNITKLTNGIKVQNSFPVWNNKGNVIAYTSTKRNGADRDIYIMDPMDSSTNKLLLERKGGGWGVRDWSPDDRFLLISEFVSRTESHYYLLEVESGDVTEITAEHEGDAYFSQGEFDAEGKGIYLITDINSDFERVAYMDLATRKVQYLSQEIPWNVSGIEINRACDKLAFMTNEAGVSNLYMIDLPGGTPQKLDILPTGVSGGMKFHNNGVDLSLSINSARSPTDVYVYNLSTGLLTQWTQSPMGGMKPEELSVPELVKWSSFDGLEISGFIYRPDGGRFTGRRPVIIDVHGGPEGQSRPVYLGFQNYYINELGIAVIYPNVRGSSGYGKNFLDLDNGMNRENSVKDIGALLDWISQQADLYPERVMVTGGSYGGYMALAVSVHYTDRIRCAVDVVGISNFNTFLKNTESYRRDLRRVEYGDERDPEMYAFLESISPLNNAGKIRNPILIVQGSNDPRVPRTEAEQMKDKILQNGGKVWYLEAKDEGHGFAKKSNADYLRYVTVAFVKEFLLGG